MFTVHQVVASMGKGEPEAISRETAGRLGLTLDGPDYKTFKRRVYEDLSELERENLLVGVRTDAAGAPLDDKDIERKNFRVHYVTPNSADLIPGGGYLTSRQARFIQPKRHLEFRVEPWGTAQCEGAKFITLWDGRELITFKVTIATLPVTIVIARAPIKDDYQPIVEDLEGKFGKRAAYLLWNEASISKVEPGKKLGHLAITWKSQTEPVIVEDLGSSLGSKYAAIETQHLEREIEDCNHENPTTKQAQWGMIENRLGFQHLLEPTALSSPSLLLLGRWLIACG